MYIVTVDAEKCDGSAKCVDVCPQGVFEMEDSKSVPVNSDECIYCESCLSECPTGAITITEV